VIADPLAWAVKENGKVIRGCRAAWRVPQMTAPDFVLHLDRQSVFLVL
jgi:hypothetical protein